MSTGQEAVMSAQPQENPLGIPGQETRQTQQEQVSGTVKKRAQNPNRLIRIEKVTLNVGAGKDPKQLERGVRLLKLITGIEPVKTVTMKRIAAWGLRPRLPIGCKLTLRNEQAQVILKRLLAAKDNHLKETQIDATGNISFGIHEYIDIPDVKYDPDLGVLGLEVCVTFERPGFRIKRRRMLKRKVPSRHRITKEEVITYLESNFSVSFKEDE
ncbi:MAG: 50S ribosomal protein L5 [DPANN group archaeon]|nr:50S ribosomal protein L5 [DPANN group archaeon]